MPSLRLSTLTTSPAVTFFRGTLTFGMASSVVPRIFMASVKPGNAPSQLRSTSGWPPSHPADATRGEESILE